MLAQLNAHEGRFEEAVAQGREAVRLLEGIGSFKAQMARDVLSAIEARAAGGPSSAESQPKLLETLLAMPAEEALAHVENALEQTQAGGPVGLEVMLLAVKTIKCWQAGHVAASDEALAQAGHAIEQMEGDERREAEAFLAQVKGLRARGAHEPSEAVQRHNDGLERANQGDFAGALASFQRSAELSRAEGDDQGVAINLFCVAQMLLMLGRAGEARAATAEGMGLAAALGNEELLDGFRKVAEMAAGLDPS